MADIRGRRVKSETEGSSKSKKNSFSFSTPRDIPKGNGFGGGSRSSTPVGIPDWSKKKVKNLWDDACSDDDGDDDYDHHYHDSGVVDDDGDVMIPPHEFLARRLASTRIASHSMCEGVGRTLKGRDLSKVRNAVLTKTGFIE